MKNKKLKLAYKIAEAYNFITPEIDFYEAIQDVDYHFTEEEFNEVINEFKWHGIDKLTDMIINEYFKEDGNI